MATFLTALALLYVVPLVFNGSFIALTFAYARLAYRKTIPFTGDDFLGIFTPGINLLLMVLIIVTVVSEAWDRLTSKL